MELVGSARGSGAGVIPEGEAKDRITYGSHTDQDWGHKERSEPPAIIFNQFNLD